MAVYLSLYYRSSAIIKIAIAFACALFWPMPYAYAQSATATLSGVVEDQNGSVIPNAEVIILNPSTMRERRAFTSGDGYFTFTSLQPASYTIKALRDGFTGVEISDVVLNINDQRSIKVQLKVGAVGAVVNIEGASLTKTDAAVSTVVDRKFVESLPLNGRSLQSLITLTPGVVLTNAGQGQFSVNGQRSNANYFTVDGVSANAGINFSSDQFLAQTTSGSLPGLTTFGGTNSLVSIDALQEFKIQTSTYAPEFGRQPGGQISLLTRSGTNELRGTLFEYLRNEAFDANDWFNNRARQPKLPLRQNQFGGVVGGPVYLPRLYDGKDRTFFFFSYEGLRLLLPKTQITSVPSLRLRQNAYPDLRPALNAFPVPTESEFLDPRTQEPTGLAPFTASYSDPSSLNATGIRIDHTVHSRLTLFGRYNNATSQGRIRKTNNPSVSDTTNLTNSTSTLGATLLINARLNSELRANYSRNDGKISYVYDNFGGAVSVEPSSVFPSFTSPNSSSVAFILNLPGSFLIYPIGNITGYIQRQINLTDHILYTTGKHQLKFGIDYRRLAPIYEGQDYSQGRRFDSQTDILNGVVSLLTLTVNERAEPLYTNFSAFAQDSWKLFPRLTMTYGLRWELNPSPSEADGKQPLMVAGVENPASIKLAPSGTPFYKTTYMNFAPRIGLAYNLSQKQGKETVLRGGFGVYYDLGNSLTSRGFVGAYPFVYQTTLRNVSYPITLDIVKPPSSASALSLPYSGPVFAVTPNLKLPYTLQWNITAEQSLGSSQTFSVAYVGATGRDLLSLRTIRLNPSFRLINYILNDASSDYHSLQLQYQRRLSRGLQAMASYTWSHAIDEVSEETTTVNGTVRGNAAFDVRHNFAAAVTYKIPMPKVRSLIQSLLRDWSLNAIIRAQSGTPLDVRSGLFIDEFGQSVIRRPDLLLDVPLYLDDPTAPGGRVINRAAFQTPLAGQPGTLGRNVLRQLPTHQIDFSLHRLFSFTEHLRLQFRAEAFNVLNHPNFGSIDGNLASPAFGRPIQMLGRSLGGLAPIYQVGGPRSLQFTIKLEF